MISKDEMRRAARALRRRLAAEALDAGVRLAEQVGGLPKAAMSALYLPVGSELDTLPFARRLAGLGRGLCLPVVVEAGMPLVFRQWRPQDPLQPDLQGIAAPINIAPEVTPDLILTPLLAFDAFGGRLGQGGGYYDRTFAAHPDALRIGVAYAGQAVARVPMEPHDIRLHGVLTETGYTPARKAD
ncbi:5-formyltetrahydrofolate cyclo-ligase [Brevundimonas aveniformis]|uniref:5-formyltetrahydrofolate cyclo-ligase n=1 Tax=Brevundimonas aveniformis TaxID=370977 RepID=UPI00041DF299|nr:5-formyltetrahydrofolate cyclo-ligase [Brevundimonas aveniformis]